MYYNVDHCKIKHQQETDPIADLQSRLKDLELSKAHADTSVIIRKERADMLLKLRKIMEVMESEQASGGGGASSKELKKVNAKQNYRIEHLVHNLRESMQ